MGQPEAQTDPGKAVDTTTIAPVSFDAVYVVNGDSASVSVINAETDTVAGTITLKGLQYPHDIALSPDGSHLGIAVPGFDMSGGESGHAVHSSRKGTVLLLDASTGALRSSTTLDAASNNVVFSSDGAQIITSQATTPGTTLVLDATSLERLATIPVGTEPAETLLSRDSTLAFVANSGSGSVSVIDVAGKSVKTTVKVGDGPVAANASADGLIFVRDEPEKTVHVVDATSLAVVRAIDLGYRPGTITPVSKDEVWITAPDKGLVEVRDSTGNVLRSVATAAGAQYVVFSADHARAYVSNTFDGSVSVVDRGTMTIKTKITVGGGPNGMVWRSK